MKKGRIKKLIVFIMLVVSFITYLNIKASGDAKVKYEKVIVYPGDTIWDIASEYKKSGDIRDVVYKIMDKNKLANATIYPGQELIVPLE